MASVAFNPSLLRHYRKELASMKDAFTKWTDKAVSDHKERGFDMHMQTSSLMSTLVSVQEAEREVSELLERYDRNE